LKASAGPSLRNCESHAKIHSMLSEQRLCDLLRRVPGANYVVAGREGGKLIGLVVSPGFAGMEEHERQALVWGLILDNFTDGEQAQVRYVFTNTPEEKAMAQAEAEAESGA
jgi:hypothetical protein